MLCTTFESANGCLFSMFLSTVSEIRVNLMAKLYFPMHFNWISVVISTNYTLLIRIDLFRVLLNQTRQFIPVYTGSLELLPFTSELDFPMHFN